MKYSIHLDTTFVMAGAIGSLTGIVNVLKEINPPLKEYAAIEERAAEWRKTCI